jgi:hemoglobin
MAEVSMDGDGTDSEQKAVSPYEMMGGADAVRRLVDRFYEIMDTDLEAADLRRMHAGDLGPIRERLFEFLSGWLGGPPLYFQRPGHNCIMSAHRPYAIGEAVRDQWMMCIRRAMADTGVSEELRALLDKPFLRMCEAFMSRPKPAAQPASSG